MKIHILGKAIGNGEGIFIVAEVGTTIGKDLETGLKLIQAAKEAGADAIKPILTDPEGLMADRTQTYRHETSYGWREDNIYELLLEMTLDIDHWKKLANETRDLGMKFGLTVDTVGGLRLAEEHIRPDFYKLSCWDLRNAPLIQAMGRTKRAVLVDLGPAVIGEVHNVLKALMQPMPELVYYGTQDIVLTYETHATNISEMNLLAIRYLRDIFPEVPIGWSNDGRDELPDYIAISLGANLIEKRLTLDRHSKQWHHHWKSLDPVEFKAWVAKVRSPKDFLGRYGLFPSFDDVRQRDLYYTSLRAARDIRAGKKIAPKDLCAKRPGAGISPFYAYLFEGKVAARDITKDQAMAWEDVAR